MELGARRAPSLPIVRCLPVMRQVRARAETRVLGVATDLIGRAMAGDGEAFRELTEPHRRELKVHCYRMLGSLQDAEDALQETLLTAWRSIGAFEARASIRTWLYRIATSRCLNVLRTASRRPAKAWDIPGLEAPERAPRGCDRCAARS
jgi:DNA-directed RNA polymerase specialized sigma24 family protein